MNAEYFTDPIPHFILSDVFTKDVADELFKEILSNEKKFTSATTRGGINSMRTNTVFYPDDVYNNRRSDSIILSSFDKLFGCNENFNSLLTSAAYPLLRFNDTTYHETQVSRYGDEGQKYDWHVDSNDRGRIITAVYYFADSGEWSGGEIEFTDSPLMNDKPITKNPNIVTIKPKPNTIVVFGGNVAHRVKQTKSSKKFNKGRFSGNIWIGERR